MEIDVPIDIARDILSKLTNTGEIILASHISQSFFRARKSLSSFFFDSSSFQHKVETNEVEPRLEYLANTLLLCEPLRSLSLHIERPFAAGVITNILWYHRNTLVELKYNVKTNYEINVFYWCNPAQLQILDLHNVRLETTNFPNLKTLSMAGVTIDFLALDLLIKSSSNLENLSLNEIIIESREDNPSISLISENLRRFSATGFHLDEIEIEAPKLEKIILEEMQVETVIIERQWVMTQICNEDAISLKFESGEWIQEESW